MEFKTCKDNKNYILVNIWYDLYSLLTNDDIDLDAEVYDEIDTVFGVLADTARLKAGLGLTEEIALPKDELIGEYLINNFDNKNIINRDHYIKFKDVVSAFNTAVYEDDRKMSNKILELFKNREYGYIDDLKRVYDESVIDYINENKNFDKYINQIEENYHPKKYLVYEDKNFITKQLEEKEKIKVKKYGD